MAAAPAGVEEDGHGKKHGNHAQFKALELNDPMPDAAAVGA